MPQFLLLLTRAPNHLRGATPEAFDRMFARYQAWMTHGETAGKVVVGHALTDEGGKLVRSREGSTSVTDGPYAEAKEGIGGSFVVRGKDNAETAEVPATIPVAEYGSVVGGRIDYIGQPEP